MSSPVAVVLAAGRGTRMKSELPKVMFPALGRPMIHWVIDAMETAGCERCIVVVGYRADDVRQELASRNNISFALQEQQLGTGHAVTMCHEQLKDHAGPVIIVAGDSPLIQAASVKRLFEEFSRGKLTCLLGTLKKDDPTGLGRIVRDAAGKFERIIEQKDATEEQKQIREVNMSTYLFENQALQWALSKLSNSNSQQEYYLTDCPAILRGAGHQVDALPILQPCESLSINTIEELAIVEAKMQELGYGK